MRITRDKIQARELKAGDMFIGGWDEVEEPDLIGGAVGWKVFIRLDTNIPEGEEDAPVERVTIHP